MAQPNVLDPSSVLHKTTKAVDILNSPYDAIAAASHAIMLSVGFRFAGIGDDARQEGDGTQTSLPTSWNEQGPSCYQFRYSHPQSSLTFIIKIVKLADKCLILGHAITDNKIAQFDINMEDYTSASFFPYRINESDQPLVHGFISSTRLDDYIKAYKLNIIQRLIPGLNKPGYEETRTSNTASPTTSSNTRPSQPPQPSTGQLPHPRVDDPYRVGQSDLEPMGGLRMPGRDGMFLGPDHPIFGNRGGSLDDPSGLFGGPQPLPRGSVPPGARFDPIGPFGQLPARPRQPGRRDPRHPFSGEPDNDELMPPGYTDMFG
ncbi:PI31 proteasome regulator N-terminal-domain-containing protein [Pilobolus umbonatus]|nr:PI31 proteasome regulator N-terminal-domain-containing protein [Pilobolus umbonatus]